MKTRTGTPIQRYAMDSQGNLVNAQETTNDNGPFFCIQCKRGMILKQGKIREWHFAHKTNSENCSYESYLHKLAKIRLCDWFNNAAEIPLFLEWNNECPRINNCFWAKCPSNSTCKIPMYKKWNLKKWYSTCEMEKQYGKYKADLFLPYNGDKDAPLFIEICVTHPCDEDKINSGVRIIEFTIASEEDIDEIINHQIKGNDKTKIYNFKPKSNSSHDKFIYLHKFILGTFNKITTETTTCKNTNNERKGYFEMTISEHHFQGENSLRELGVIMAILHRYKIKYCDLCKWRDDGERKVACKVFRTNPKQTYLKFRKATYCKEFERDETIFRFWCNERHYITYRIWDEKKNKQPASKQTDNPQ